MGQTQSQDTVSEVEGEAQAQAGWSFHPDPQPIRLRNPSVTILKEIIRTKIQLDGELERENNAILQDFLELFIRSMRADDVFNSVFSRIYYTGSYYSDLRIATPNEFDLNLVLKLPFKDENIEVEFKNGAASYAKLRLRDPSQGSHNRLLRTFFLDSYLIPENIRKWLQSVVDKALRTCSTPRNCIRMIPSASGPARTIRLLKRDDSVIDIDFVPVIEYTLTRMIPGIDDRIFRRMFSAPVQCFLVPKPYRPSDETVPANPAECRQLWRLHFPDLEKQFIHHLGCAKPIIKLLKLLRDKDDWRILASYYLKTVVMWLILQKPQDEEWNEEKMGEKFIEVLKKLNEYVEQINIPYFFSTPHNLISKMNSSQASNISCRLRRHIRRILENPENLWDIFGVRPTFTLTN